MRIMNLFKWKKFMVIFFLKKIYGNVNYLNGLQLIVCVFPWLSYVPAS